MTHPVVKHLLKRKDQKVPIADGRKISLLLFGGIMTGIRGSGALEGLIDVGLTDAFDDIYSVSAGFPNACYFLNKNKTATSIYYKYLCGKEFINFLRPWKLVDIDYLLGVMDTGISLDYRGVSEHPTRLHVKLLELKSNKKEYVQVNNLSHGIIRRIMKAAISIPYLNPGAVQIGDKVYKDGGAGKTSEKEDLEHVLSTDATDIVIIYNRLDQYETAKAVGMFESDRVLQILPPTKSELSKFCTDSKCLKEKAEEMSSVVKNIFCFDK